ncbi:MAG TPA: GGDEF domain-containing protein, partial [Holophaga sp.]|nr:GGDEF domain-containing protein [Holophaga sp.]
LISLLTFLALEILEVCIFLGFHWYRRTQVRVQEELTGLVEARTAELREANRALEEASMVDILTGLKNRRFLDVTLPTEIARVLRVHRARQQPPMNPSGVGDDIVIMVIDLDHFKLVNDTYGHAAGDAVLQEVGAMLREHCRESDLVARWGGEEFLIAAMRTHRAYAPVIAGKLLEMFRQHVFTLPGGETIQKTCSIGYCPFPVVPEHTRAVAWERAVGLADLCLYAAKRNGRDAWVGVAITAEDDQAVLAANLPGGFLDLVQDGTLQVQSSFTDGRRLQWS